MAGFSLHGTIKPTAPKKPAGTVPAKAKPAPAAPPWLSDPVYTGTTSGIHTGLANLHSYLIGQGGGLASDYGVTVGGSGDPTAPGPKSPSYSIDPNVDVTNPFSRAALLKRAHNQHTAGNTNSYAASGQLYAGSLQNAKNAEETNYQQGQDTLLKDFSSQYGGLYGQWLAAQQTAGQGVVDAQAASIAAHANDPAVAPAAPGTAASGIAPFVSTTTAKPVKLTPLQVAAAKATGGSASSQAAQALVRRARNDPKLKAQLLGKKG